MFKDLINAVCGEMLLQMNFNTALFEQQIQVAIVIITGTPLFG